MPVRKRLPAPPKTGRGEETRRKILAAAKREIGRRGYAETSVSAITAEAGVAQGTFYLYFPSKEDVLRELVLDMGQQLRQHLAAASHGAQSRIEAERRGLKAFLAFTRNDPDLYRVVAESQFVDEAIYRQYYLVFAESYRTGLEAAARRGELKPGDAEVRAWALMGLSVFLGQRYALWDRSTPLDEVVDSAIGMIADGMAP